MVKRAVGHHCLGRQVIRGLGFTRRRRTTDRRGEERRREAAMRGSKLVVGAASLAVRWWGGGEGARTGHYTIHISRSACGL